MEACRHFEDLLLDSLYGLLEAGEEESLRAHVANCSACAAAMAEARQQHDLLARAAQVISQVPAFVAPEDQPLIYPAEPVGLPLEPKLQPAEAGTPTGAGKRRRPWKRWVGLSAAAALLLAAGTAWTIYQRNLEDYQTNLARARKEVEAIDAQFVQVQNAAKDNKTKIIAQIHREVAHVQVVGPTGYQPDAPSPLRVMTRDVEGKPLPAQVVTRLLNAQKKELFRAETASKGEAIVSLPAGLTATGDKAQLVVEADAGEARARIEETLRVQEPALVTHLATNKSVFQVGEVMFFRTLTLERFSLKPVTEKIPLYFTLVDARGKAVKQIPGQTGAGGIAGGMFALTNDLIAGEYTLRITQAGTEPRMLPQERKVEILRDLPPQFQFDRRQYFAGETGKATITTRRTAGGFGKLQELEVKGHVDGKGISINGNPPGVAVKMPVDPQGNASITFKVPSTIKEGDALLKILVQNGTNKEKVVQPIPVVATNLAVDFYPEGGDLLAGVPNRVYYRIRTPLGEPVTNPQGSGVIILGMREPKKVVLNVEQKQGFGMFTFTPEVNETYRLWITYPNGVTEIPDPFQKIKILPRGVALSVPEAVGHEKAALTVVVHNTGPDRRLAVLATCRGRVVAEEFFVARKGINKIGLTPVAGTRGVVRLTVYDAAANTLTPLAERLVFRIPAEQLRLSVTGLKQSYRQGERANLQLEARDEEGRKTAAWLGAAVVDERALLTADQDAASPQAHFFLLSEVRRPEDLEQADLLLVDSPQGRQALDLFLGTQGWRRFVPTDGASTMFARDKAAKDAVIFSRENASPTALAVLHDARLQESLAQLGRETAQKRQDLSQERERRMADARLAALELARMQNLPAEVLRLGAGFLVLALLVAGVLFLVWGLACVRRRVSPTIGFAGSCCALLLCLILYGAAGSLPTPTADPEQLLARLSRKAWPTPENGQVAKTIPPRGWSAGVFALAPAKAGEKSTTPLSTAFRAPNRGLSQLAKADNGDRPSLAQMEPQMQNRFNEAQKFQDTLAKAAKAKSALMHPAPGGGKGGADAKSNLTAGDLAREYFYTYQNHSRKNLLAPATLLWHPNLSAPDGSAQVSFDLSQSGATYRIILFGNTPSGRLGSFQGKLQTSK